MQSHYRMYVQCTWTIISLDSVWADPDTDPDQYQQNIKSDHDKDPDRNQRDPHNPIMSHALVFTNNDPDY